MTDWICKEVQTDNGGYFEPVKELIRCKDCKFDGQFEQCDILLYENDYCSRAERKEE